VPHFSRKSLLDNSVHKNSGNSPSESVVEM
jgi:hypothetical protein